MDKVAVNEDVRNLIEETIREIWKYRNEYEALIKQDRQKALEEISDRMKKIRTTMLTSQNVHLVEELEVEWELVCLEKEKFQNEIEKDSKLSEEELENLLVQAKKIYMWLKTVWELSNTELKSTLVSLLFGEKLLYTKENGFRTAWKTLYDAVLSAIHGTDFLDQNKNKK